MKAFVLAAIAAVAIAYGAHQAMNTYLEPSAAARLASDAVRLD